MTSVVDILPPELIEHIIDILAFDDHFNSSPHNPFKFPNIKACALTCRAFYLRSCYHQFSAIKIYDRYTPLGPAKGSMTLDDLERFVKTYPECARRVRELHYSIRGRICYSPSIDDAIPQSLSNLQSLVISPYRGSMDWGFVIAYTEDQKDALMRILHLPTLISLKVTRAYHFRPSDLIPCTNLQSLSLQSVSTYAEEDTRFFVSRRVVSIKNTAPIRLRHLEVGGSAINTVAEMLKPSVEDECPILDLQDLKELEVKGGLQPQYLASTIQIFINARQLQHIRFEVGRQTSFELLEFSVPLILTTMDTLRSLSFDLYLSGPTESDPDQPDSFEALLGTLYLAIRSTQNNIISLQVQIRIGPKKSNVHMIENWKALERILLMPKGWPALTHFDLAIIIQGQRPNSKAMLLFYSRGLSCFLPDLFSQKVFKFTFFCGKEGKYIPRVMEY